MRMALSWSPSLCTATKKKSGQYSSRWPFLVSHISTCYVDAVLSVSPSRYFNGTLGDDIHIGGHGYDEFQPRA